MKPPSRISILVPAYNHERYVETCVRSVLERTFRCRWHAGNTAKQHGRLGWQP